MELKCRNLLIQKDKILSETSKLWHISFCFPISWVGNVKDNMSNIMATYDATTVFIWWCTGLLRACWNIYIIVAIRYLYVGTCTSVRITFQQYVDIYQPVCTTTIQTWYSTLLLSISYKTLARSCYIRSRDPRRSTMCPGGTIEVA